MQANGSRPRGLTVLVPFCVGIWGSVGQSHPPVPCQMLARTSGGAAAPKSKGKGTGGGGFYPKKSWGGNTASSSAGAMGQEGRPAARPSVPAGTQRGGRISGRVSFFFFFWRFPVNFVATVCGSLGSELPRQRQLGVRVSVLFFPRLATPQRF